jgi:hypothetical protein
VSAQAVGEPAAARLFAMGGVSAALPANPWAGATNPAGLHGLERPWATLGLHTARFTQTQYSPFDSSQASFSDSYARPSFAGLAYPLGRVTLQASWASLLRRQTRSQFASANGQSSDRDLASVSELGLSAAFRVTPTFALGASLGATQLSLESEYGFSRVLELRSTGPTPQSYTSEQVGSDWSTSFALGVLRGSPETRWSFGFVWRKGQSFEIPYSASESFPSLDLQYAVATGGEMATGSAVLGGLSVRLFDRRLRLGLDVSYPGEPSGLYVVAATCVPHPPPAPQICAALGPGPSLGWVARVGAEGWFGRLGAEVALTFRTPLFVRAGVENNVDSERFTFGAGTLLAGRFQVDVAAGVKDGDWRGILTLSLAI